MNLSENEKQIILRHIQEGQPLPKEYIYKLLLTMKMFFFFGMEEKKKLPIRFYPFIPLNILTNHEWNLLNKPIFFR